MHIKNLLLCQSKNLFDVALQATLAGDFIRATFSSLPFACEFASSYSKGLNSVIQSDIIQADSTTNINCLVAASYNGDDQYLSYTGSKDWTGTATPVNCEVTQDTSNPNLFIFSNFTPSTPNKTTACNVVLNKYDYIEEGEISYFGYNVKYTPYWVFSKAGKWKFLIQIYIDGQESLVKITKSLTVEANMIYTDEVYAQKYDDNGYFLYTLPFCPGTRYSGGDKESFMCTFTWSYVGPDNIHSGGTTSYSIGNEPATSEVVTNTNDTQNSASSAVREITLTPLMQIDRARKLTVL